MGEEQSGLDLTEYLLCARRTACGLTKKPKPPLYRDRHKRDLTATLQRSTEFTNMERLILIFEFFLCTLTLLRYITYILPATIEEECKVFTLIKNLYKVLYVLMALDIKDEVP